jgi:PBSX family phage terminase large subunit
MEHRYTPRGSAVTTIEHHAKEVLVSGPAGTGKSRACLEKLLLLALNNPGFKALIVRKTAVSLSSSALQTWRRIVAKEALAVGVCWFYGGSVEEPAQYRFKNGSSIAIGGMDKPSKIMSTEYDVIYAQESIELTVDDWEALLSRLRNYRISYQQLLADANPDRPTHWLRQRVSEGKTVMLESRHEDNPMLFDDAGQLTEKGADYLATLDLLTGVRRSRLRLGQWVSAAGSVYEDEFDPAVNVVDRFEIPADWGRIWSVDFGFVHPFVLQCWAQDPDGRLYLYREIYRTRRLVEDHARDILRRVTKLLPGCIDTGNDLAASIDDGRRVWTEPAPRLIVCDHDAEDRATLERHLGMGTTPAHKTVSEGIQAVAARWRREEDGKPRLALLRDSVIERDPLLEQAKKPTCTADEVPGYMWDMRDGKVTKDQPLKQDDDGCDALRYTVAECDLGASLNVRWLE